MKKLLLTITFFSLLINGFSQTTYIVNSIEDLPDINMNDAICADANGNCTLRAAIQNANKTSNKDTIEFNISGSAPFTILLATSELPTIGYPIIIDGRTQTEYATSNSPVIEIDGSGLPINSSGLKLYGFSDASEIYGLSIGGFQRLNVFPFSAGYGIDVFSQNTIIQSNYIGLKPDGATLNRNEWGVYFLDSGNNTFGGTGADEKNVVSGNYAGGLTFEGVSSSNNLVQGNLFGTDATGLLPRGNRFNLQFLDAPNNIVGGNTPEARNILSGGVNNQGGQVDGTGISITGVNATNNTIIGNYIGTDITGTVALSNMRGGILLLFGASNNIIGTDNVGEGNVISGNGSYGIYFQGNTASPVVSNSIKGNYIGIDATGNSALPNTIGIMMLTGENNNNNIGGTTPNSKNVISGNSNAGIVILKGTNNQILGNYIGTNALGTIAISNGIGIDLEDGNNSIGGQEVGSRNIISGNSTGIYIAQSTSSGCVIKGNYIGLNASGNAALPNSTGIIISQTATNITIGGPDSLDRNIISGNSNIGINMATTSSTIQNNYIGLNPEGNAVIKNINEGLRLIGNLTGTQISENTISGNGTVSNTGRNVNFFNSSNNVHFFNNKVGTLPDGITGVANVGSGLTLFNSNNNIIGGDTELEGNIIGSHNLNAIVMVGSSNNNTVSYNKIGVGLDGISDIGNAIIGIAISGDNTGNTITKNRIANNDRGVVLQASGGTPTQVRISENSMFNNSVIGIDLVGTTANDVDDADTGVNNLQNTPEIGATNYLGGTAIEITYAVPSSISNSAYPLVIEFFGAVSDQGKFFIESDTYAAPGNKTVTINLPNGFDPNDYINIVATATDDNGNTSEFGIATGVTLSLAQLQDYTFKIYPNPVSNQLYIKYSTSEKVNLEVRNILGQIVLIKNDHTSSASLDVSNLSKGLYFLNIDSENGYSQTIKFIKN